MISLTKSETAGERFGAVVRSFSDRKRSAQRPPPDGKLESAKADSARLFHLTVAPHFCVPQEKLMIRLIIIGALALLLAATTQAQQPMPGRDMGPGMSIGMDNRMVVPNATDTPSSGDYKAVMMKMMMAMQNFTGDADIDFMAQMRPHHQAAIDMANVVLAQGTDLETKKLAENIIAAQEKEIGLIDAWLKKKGS
jgi:Domain of unknown function (DUF305)